jgi:tetratricopeptide (TPR) repeat protein
MSCYVIQRKLLLRCRTGDCIQKSQAGASPARVDRAAKSAFAATLGLLFVAAGNPAAANSASAALRARAAAELYNLDDRAVATYREAVAADPDDAAAHRGLASALWLSVTAQRGLVTVDSYLGAFARRNVSLPPPRQEVAREFQQAVDRALALTQRRLAAHANDADALFDLGAAIALRASYLATVDGRVLAALRVARDAYDAHEKVLSLAPRRRDAALIVGTYRYLVSTQTMPVRWIAYIVGFGGGRERGIRLVEDASDHGGENSVDARVALVLMYNREGRYPDALRHLDVLRAAFPRNRVLIYETGSTYLRAGKAAEAERFLTQGITTFSSDPRQRMFGEHALWYFKRGSARAALGRTEEARADLERALSSVGRKWVHGRTHLELGKLAAAAGNRGKAREHFEEAIRLCSQDQDGATAEQARRLMRRQ